MVNSAHTHTFLPLKSCLFLSHTLSGPTFHSSFHLFKVPYLPFQFLLSPSTPTSPLKLSNATTWYILPLSFYPHPIFLSSPSSPPRSPLFNLPYCFLPIALSTPFSVPFPISFIPFPPLSLFIPRCSLPLSLWPLTYLSGADIVVFMRAASPTAAEGRPHNLALVAALGLVRQMDIWTKTSKETNKLTNRGTEGQREKRGGENVNTLTAVLKVTVY